MKALHVTQIRDQVMSHITKVPEHAFRTQFIELERQRERERQKRHNDLLIGQTPRHPIHPDNMTREMRQQLRHHILQRSQPQENQDHIGATGAPPRPITLARPVSQIPAANNIYTGLISRNDLFQLRPKFLRIIQSVHGVGQDRSIFTVEEATILLSTYILSRKDFIFDNRNIKVAIIHNDPLGEAFNVRAFHRIQVENLLRSQLLRHSNSCSQHRPLQTIQSNTKICHSNCNTEKRQHSTIINKFAKNTSNKPSG